MFSFSSAKLSFTFFCLYYSVQMKLNLDYLLEMMWENLDLLRIYTKKPGSTFCFQYQIKSAKKAGKVQIVSLSPLSSSLFCPFRASRFQWLYHLTTRRHGWACGESDEGTEMIWVFFFEPTALLPDGRLCLELANRASFFSSATVYIGHSRRKSSTRSSG